MNTFVIHYHNFLGQLQSDFPHLDISAGHNRTQSTQALIQLGVLVMTLFAAIIGGALTGNIDVICTKVCTENATTLICTCTHIINMYNNNRGIVSIWNIGCWSFINRGEGHGQGLGGYLETPKKFGCYSTIANEANDMKRPDLWLRCALIFQTTHQSKRSIWNPLFWLVGGLKMSAHLNKKFFYCDSL